MDKPKDSTWSTVEKRGGYPAGSKKPGEGKPPPASMSKPGRPSK